MHRVSRFYGVRNHVIGVLLLGVLLFSGGACRLGFARQFVRSLPIASREVKWNEAGDARSFGDIARLARR